jgi:hypothetical protein
MCTCKGCYLVISGLIFGLLTAGHIARLVYHWPVNVGEWKVPLGASWGGAIGGGILCIWALSLLCGCCCGVCKDKKSASPPA